jgi:hypothetical protein
LNQAIQHYTRGMELDYNLYYCSSNLPQLLLARGKSGDAARAATIEEFVLAACERALKRGEQDEWLKATLFGAAFRARDVSKAEELADRVEEEGGRVGNSSPRWRTCSAPLSRFQSPINRTRYGKYATGCRG